MIARRDVLILSLISAAVGGCAGEGNDTSAAVAEIRGGGHVGHFTARALLARDAQTQFETSTGTLDSTTPPPGEIASLLLSVFNADGTVRFTRRYDHLDPLGAYSFVLAGLARGTNYQIDARVSAVHPPYFTNVQVNDFVRLRPDIIVGPDRVRIVGPDHTVQIVGPDRVREIVGPDRGIVGPDHIAVNRSVTLAALFSEVNGDVGGKADCTLTIDDVVVDTHADLVVPAGSSTMCSFNTSFSTVGRHSVMISATNVVPLDYDPGNNSYAFSVSIVGPDRWH